MENNQTPTKLTRKSPLNTPELQKAPSPTQTQDERLTATERLNILEDNYKKFAEILLGMQNKINSQADEIVRLRRNIAAIIKISEDGKSLSGKELKSTIEEANINMLKDRVNKMLEAGLLLAADEVKIDSFVVGHQKDKEGKVVNVRLQLPTSVLMDTDLAAILGARVGQSVNFENGTVFQVEEIFTIIEMPAYTPEEAAAVDEKINELEASEPLNESEGTEEMESPETEDSSSQQA